MASPLRILCLSFAIVGLAACASTAPTPLEPLAPTVVQGDEVARLWAPNGRADVRILARGHHAFVAVLRMDAGAKVPVHQDESEEYIYVLEGSGAMTIDGVTTEVSPGTAVFMPANATVTFSNGDAEMVAVQIFADPRSAAKYERWLTERPTTP